MPYMSPKLYLTLCNDQLSDSIFFIILATQYVNLESCLIAEAKGFLRDAIYEELNMQLVEYDGAHTCHAIHPTIALAKGHEI